MEPKPLSRKTEASDPSTSPARLSELAKLGCACQVAGNPNTPVALLLKLAARHFDGFLANPVLPLLQLEDPGFCTKIPAAALRRLLRRTELPEHFLQAVRRHSDRRIREDARWHVLGDAEKEEIESAVKEALRTMPPNSGKLGTLLAFGLVPAMVLEPLAAGTNATLRKQVAQYLNGATDPAAVELREFLVATGAMSNTRGVVRARSDLDEASLARLAGGGTRARWLAARHGRTPEHLLRKLAADESRTVQIAALKNQSLPEAVLWSCATVPRTAVRCAVALNLRTPPGLLSQLAGDASVKVRRVVAGHWAVPPETLAVLAGDPDHEVQRRVARHRMTPPPTLAKLAASPHVEVRTTVARHRYLPPESRDILAADAVPGVVGAIARRGDLSDEWLAKLLSGPDDEHFMSFDACYFNPRVPREWKYEISQNKLGFERMLELIKRVAKPPRRAPGPQKPNVPAQWCPQSRVARVRWWSSDEGRKHHEACVAKAPDVLLKLGADERPAIRRMVAYNANTPPEKLAEFASDPSPEVRQFLASNTKCPAEILTRLASDSCPKVRSYVVRHVNTSEGVIVAMSGDADESVQEALAGNSHTPPDVLRKLLALSLQTKRALAGNPSIPEDVARALTESDDEFVLRAIAANSALPVDCARRFLADSRFEVRAAAVTNSAIPVEEIAVLLDDPEVSIRQHLAKRVPHPLLLPRLLADSSADVVEALARNGRLDAATCETLSRHPSAKIRAAIVQNPVTPLENIRALFDCKEEPVVTAIASLHRLPPEAVMEFASRHLDEPKAWYGILHRNVLPESFLERVAAEGPATLKSLLSNQQGLPASVYLALVANGARELWVGLAMHCPEPAVLEKLAEVGDDSIRYWAAKNSKISPARLLKLAHSEPMSGYYETGMRLAAARHPRIAGDALRELFLREVPFFKSQQRQRRRWRRAGKDSDAVMLAFIQRTDLDVQLLEPLLHTHDVEIQRALLSRPDLPDEWRDILLVQALHQCLAGTAPLARCCALMHPRSPAQFFAKTQQSGTWIERWAITQNPAAPAAIIKLLANDSNVIVRNAARRHGK